MKVREFAIVHKLHAGPGGWHCPCCNPFGCSVRKMKKRARRMVRRKEKYLLHKENL